jgi:hypothetical protein
MLRLVKKPAKWDLAPDSEKVLALGEHSGHAHVVVDCEVYKDPKGNKYVLPTNPKGAALLHKHLVTNGRADHDDIVLDKPLKKDECYEVVIQRSFDPFAKMFKKVID